MSILGCFKYIFRKETWFIFLALNLLTAFLKMLTWLKVCCHHHLTEFSVFFEVSDQSRKGDVLFFNFVYLLLLNFIYLWVCWVFIAACELSLRCSSFLLWGSPCGAWAQRLWLMGLVAPRHTESSQTRDQTCVACIRQILILWTTREVTPLFYYNVLPQK